MANNTEVWIPKLASEWNTKFEKLDDGITWAIDVPFKLSDDKFRYQWVYVSYGVGVAKGKDMYDIRSKVGDYSSKLDVQGILQESKFAFYSTVCIREVKREGNSVDVVHVQAGPLADYVTDFELFRLILEEVASNADIMEEKFYGVDKF